MKLAGRSIHSSKKRLTIADLYPELSKEEQLEAEYNLRRYIRLVWRIFERVSRENPKALTEALKEARLKKPDHQNTSSSQSNVS
jgi:hypothetical protein